MNQGGVMSFLSRLFGRAVDEPFDRGLRLYHKERYDEAMTVLAEVLKENPAHTEALAVMGNIFFVKEKYSQAIECYLKAEPSTKGKENIVGLYYMLGSAYSLIDQHDKAIEAFRKGIAHDPDTSLGEKSAQLRRAIDLEHIALAKVRPFKIEIDETKIREVVSKNLLGPQTKEFSNYSFYGARCVHFAQALRQRTLGKAHEITEQSMREKPIGSYFALVESNLLRLANSLSEIGSVLMLTSVGSSDIEGIMTAASKRLSRVMGVPTDSGTDTSGLKPEEKILAYVATHKDALEALSSLYQEGCQMGMPDPALREDFIEMISFLKKELETANQLFGRG